MFHGNLDKLHEIVPWRKRSNNSESEIFRLGDTERNRSFVNLRRFMLVVGRGGGGSYIYFW